MTDVSERTVTSKTKTERKKESLTSYKPWAVFRKHFILLQGVLLNSSKHS